MKGQRRAGRNTVVFMLIALAAVFVVTCLLVLGGNNPTVYLGHDRNTIGTPPLVSEAAILTEAESEALFRQGNLEKARLGFRHLSENDLNDVSARLSLLLIAILTGDMEDARIRVDEVSRLTQIAPEALTLASVTKLLAGESAAAAESASAALEMQPDSLLVRWILARAESQNNDPCTSLSVLQPALDEASGVYQFQELRLANLAKLGDWEQHYQQMATMHRLFPENAQVSEWLFQGEVGRNQPKAAADVLRDIAATEPNNAAAAIRVVEYVRQEQGDIAAEAELERLSAIAGSPDVAAVLHLERGQILLERGEAAAAFDILRAVEMDANTSFQVLNDAKVKYATWLLSENNGLKALALIEEVLLEDASHLAALKLKSTYLLREGRISDALISLENARSIAPSDTSVLMLLAQAYERNLDPILAQDTLARAVELSKDGTEEVMAFAMLLKKHGNEQLSVRMLARLQTPQEAPEVKPLAHMVAPIRSTGPCVR